MQQAQRRESPTDSLLTSEDENADASKTGFQTDHKSGADDRGRNAPAPGGEMGRGMPAGTGTPEPGDTDRFGVGADGTSGANLGVDVGDIKSGGQTGGKLSHERHSRTRTSSLKSSDKNVLPFLPSRGQNVNKKLPSRGQNGAQISSFLRGILPEVKQGVGWWEIPADGSGYRIKFRWRAGGKKPVYVFRRLGKKEYADLEGKGHETAKRIVTRRIFTELFRAQRLDLASRLVVQSRDDQGEPRPVTAIIS